MRYYLHYSAPRIRGNALRICGRAIVNLCIRVLLMPERTEVLGKIARHMADQVTIIGLAYPTAPGAISKRRLNVSTQWLNSYITWNAHEWDLAN